MIRADGLTKKFGDVVAVDNLSFEVKDGEVFGLLGPNGAGKTTTVRLLASLIAPTSGKAWVAGHQVGQANESVRASVGILTETPGLYSRLSALENLRLFARLYGLPNDRADQQIERYLSMLNLWERRLDPAGMFSKGMRQKLAIARSLLHEPRVVFFDEPTSALDPESAKVVREFIERLRTEGRTILLLTHNLDEADRLCDRVGVFQQRLLRVDSPSALRRQMYGRKISIQLQQVSENIKESVASLPFVKDVQVEGARLRMNMEDPETNNPELVRKLVEHGANIQFLEEEKASLEKIYFDVLASAPPMVEVDEGVMAPAPLSIAGHYQPNAGANRIFSIVRKEWIDLKQNSSVLISMVVMPVLLIATVIGSGAWIAHTPESSLTSTGKPLDLPPALAALGPKMGLLVLMNDQFLFYLLLIPVTLPTVVAASSIAAEKETRSLEPLLASPIRTNELLLAKSLAAALPPMVIGWASGATTILGIALTQPREILLMALRPTWMLAMLLVSPLLALLATLLGVVASSRAQDAKSAQAISAVVIVPLVMLSMVVLIGRIVIAPEWVMGAAALLVVLNLVILQIATKLFQREVILTRWK